MAGLTAYNPDRHLGLVVSSWLHSHRQSTWARMLHPATYTQNQRATIDALLARCEPKLVAASDGTVIAWSLWERVPRTPERNILHYVWVAQPLRKSGFAARILREHSADRATVASHWTDAADRALHTSAEMRQLFCATNSHHPRFSPTLAADPNAFVAM